MAFALVWVGRGAGAAAATRAFSLALAGGLAIAWLGGLSPANRLWPACDVLGAPLMAPALVATLGLAGLTRLTAGPRRRLAVLALLGLVTLVVARAFPGGCLSNPLDRLDPILVERWLAHVAEARSGVETLAQGWDNLEESALRRLNDWLKE